MMIQLAAVPDHAVTAPNAVLPALSGAQAGQDGGFADLLALAGASAAQAPNGTSGEALAATAGKAAATPGTAAAIPGKMLPLDVLPVAGGPAPDGTPPRAAIAPALTAEHSGKSDRAQVGPAMEVAARPPSPLGRELSAAIHELGTERKPGDVPALLATLKAARAMAQQASGPDIAPEGDAGAVAEETLPETALPDSPAPVLTLAPLASLNRVADGPGAPAEAEHTPPPPLPRAIAVQMLGLPLRAAVAAPALARADRAESAAAPQTAEAVAEAPMLLPVAAGTAVAVPAFSLEGRAPEPLHAVRLRPQVTSAADSGAKDAVPANEMPAPGAAMAQVPADPGLAAAAPAPALTPAAPAGHDFAAVVDRLIAARDAQSPEAIAVSVQHAEFGRVSLHFKHDEAGLSVALASADPDFAAAVQAAVPPVAATTESATTGQAPDGGNAQTPARDGAGNPQSRGQQEQNGNRATLREAAPQPNPARKGEQPDLSGATARRGRFA